MFESERFYKKKIGTNSGGFQMKLQIVEYRAPNMLELDEKVILWTPPAPIKKELKEVYNILMDKLLDDNIDYNMEHYIKLNKIIGVASEVIFETEVSESYLKELYNERRMKSIEQDFT